MTTGAGGWRTCSWSPTHRLKARNGRVFWDLVGVQAAGHVPGLRLS